MRIAFFADNFYPELSGVSDSVVTAGVALARRGHAIEYFVPSYARRNYATGGVGERELDLGPNVAVHRMASLPYRMPSLQGRAALPNVLRGLFTRRRFDVIHSHSFCGPGLDAWCLAKVKRVPLVGTNHTLIEAFTRYSPVRGRWVDRALSAYVTWYYNKCALVTTPSDFLLNDMKRKGLRTPALAVPNPVADQFFSPRAAKAELKKQLNFPPFTVLYTGRTSPEKNTEVLLDAFIRFAKDAPDAGLVMVGEGCDRAMLEARARKSPAASHIRFIGPFLGAKQAQLFDAVHASDVFVMPSTSETQSMSTLQAMAGGVPVVAARASALPELVGSDRGLLFTPNDAEDLRSALTRLYREPELRQTIGDRARLFARQYSAQKVAQRWEEIYQHVIHEKS